MNPVELAQSTLAAPQGDLSFFALFMQAHLVVKLVMLGLIGASVWCWAIIVDKWLLYVRTRRQMNRFETVFWSGQSLEDLYRTLSGRANHGMAALFIAAMREWKRSHESAKPAIASLRQRIDRVMDVTIAREAERLEGRLLVLATVGAAAPFIGLFGTVWGIMRAFTAIAAEQNSSLAVVAPGIAEALFATAIGLFAAIPAVIAYNRFSHGINRMESRLTRFADGFYATLSRELEAQR